MTFQSPLHHCSAYNILRIRHTAITVLSRSGDAVQPEPRPPRDPGILSDEVCVPLTQVFYFR